MIYFKIDKLDTFEKCCNYLRINTQLPEVSNISEQKAIQGLYMLVIINKAWSKADNFRPNYTDNQRKWFPEFDYIPELCVFRFSQSSHTAYCSTYLGLGKRFCFKSKERSDQFGRLFIDIINSFLL